MAELRQRGGLALRLGFVALLGGGLVLFTQSRKPRDLLVDIDLTAALPGDIMEVDVVITRDGHALARVDTHYGDRGAPATVHAMVHARSGPAQVETTLVYRGRAAHRAVTQIELEENAPASVQPR